jgi:hypothetical protein
MDDNNLLNSFEHEVQCEYRGRSYFTKAGGLKYFTLAMGREWTGGDVFDDYAPS